MSKIAIQPFKEIIRFDLDIKVHAVDSKYNGQSLATDEGYCNYLEGQFKELKNSFFETDNKQDPQLRLELLQCKSLVSDAINLLKKEKSNIEYSYKNKKDQLNNIVDIIEHGNQKEQIDILNSILMMIGFQKEYLIKTKEFLSEISNLEEPNADKSPIKKDTKKNTKPNKYLIANISPNDFISIICTLQYKGIIGGISRSKLVTFLNHIQFNSTVEIENLVDTFANDLKMNDSEYIFWNDKNKQISEWIWWMVTKKIMNEPIESYKSIAFFLAEIFHFTHSKENSDIPNSIRRQFTSVNWKNSKGEIYVPADSIFNNYLNKFIPNEDME